MSMAEVFEAGWQDKSAQQDEVAGKTNGYRNSRVHGADSVAIRIQSRVMRDLAERGAEVGSGILQNVAEGAIAAMVVMRESDVWKILLLVCFLCWCFAPGLWMYQMQANQAERVLWVHLEDQTELSDHNKVTDKILTPKTVYKQLANCLRPPTN
ncbi:hypothetical protein B0H13DRAFT_1915409 [Mycena leptocephala]|nr:hypothetical protein B0H13DRAFT_1915409 [Mycena leptocephala]